jgi:hypothetical protein
MEIQFPAIAGCPVLVPGNQFVLIYYSFTLIKTAAVLGKAAAVLVKNAAVLGKNAAVLGKNAAVPGGNDLDSPRFLTFLCVFRLTT